MGVVIRLGLWFVNWLVISGCLLGRGARGVHGRDVADDDVGDPALGEALVEREAARADGAVALLVAGGERREHDAVLEREVANLDRLEQLGRCHGVPLLDFVRSDPA